LIPPEQIISQLSREYNQCISELQIRATFMDLAKEIKSLKEKDCFATVLSQHMTKGTTTIKSKLSDWKKIDGVYRY
jgi:hypothetical protein